MKKTNFKIYGEEKGKLKRLYLNDDGDICVYCFGKLWNFTKREYSFYYVISDNGKHILKPTFNNLDTIYKEITEFIKGDLNK